PEAAAEELGITVEGLGRASPATRSPPSGPATADPTIRCSSARGRLRRTGSGGRAIATGKGRPMAGEQRTERGRYGLPPSLPCPNCGRQWDMATWEPGQLACPQCRDQERHIGVVLSEDPYIVAHVGRDA